MLTRNQKLQLVAITARSSRHTARDRCSAHRRESMLLASTLAIWPRSVAQRKSSPHMRLTNEAETCRRVAAMRAVETAEGCGAFSDHLASLFAGEEQLERARALRALQPNPRSQIDAISLRCLAVDDRVLSACRGEAGIRQVLCLGCGMDSRPHRLDLPRVAWFEVDVPEVLALKEELLRTASPEVHTDTHTHAQTNTHMHTHAYTPPGGRADGGPRGAAGAGPRPRVARVAACAACGGVGARRTHAVSPRGSGVLPFRGKQVCR